MSAEGTAPSPTETRHRVADFAGSESELAVLVLQVSWALGDAAHDLPAGRMSAQRREELADALQALVFILRASAPDGGR